MKLNERLALTMRREILCCLREAQQICGAARLLGIGRQTLYDKIRAFRIVPADWRGIQPAQPDAASSPLNPPPLLLKELADLLARHSAALAPGGASMKADAPLVAAVPSGGEADLPATTVTAQSDPNGASTLALSGGFRPPARNPCGALARPSPTQRPPIIGNEPTIDLFLRLGIDLRRSNTRKRRDGFWRCFEDQLDYLLADARAAFLDRIKLAHPDRGGNSEEAASLSLAWTIIRRRFARRGIRL